MAEAKSMLGWSRLDWFAASASLLQTERIRTIEHVAAFVEANAPVEFQPLDREGAYAFVARTLTRLGYCALEKPSKSLAKRCLAKATDYSRAQLTRLIRQHRDTARVVDRRDGNQGRSFARVCTHRPTWACWHRWTRISASHIYNLRGSRTYRTQRTVVAGTKASAVTVGERRAPQPGGQPGCVSSLVRPRLGTDVSCARRQYPEFRVVPQRELALASAP